jgi:endonuclease/exonuclease/phosphatase family metal-dependent hydrolase
MDDRMVGRRRRNEQHLAAASTGAGIGRRGRSALKLPRVLLLAGILLGSTPVSAALREDTVAPTPPCDSLSLVTLNIYHDADDWMLRRPLIIKGLKELLPDVIVLQEVLQHETLRNQASDIAEALGYEEWFVSASPRGDERRFGNAILTRHPVLERTEHRLHPLDDWRTLAHARLEICGRMVDIYGTHLHHTREGEGIRARQVRDIVSAIEVRGDGTSSILAGDFNATVIAPELGPLLAQYFDAFGRVEEEAHRITTLNPHYFDTEMQRRIDHIFAERGRFEVLEARRVLDRPDDSATWPSDHFGVFAELRFESAAEAG